MTTASLTSTPTRPQLNINGWLRQHVFSNVWQGLSAILLALLTIFSVWQGFQASPIELSLAFLSYVGDGTYVPNPIGSAVLFLTNGMLLTSILLIAWAIGLGLVLQSVIQMRWTPTTQWLKDSLYTGVFSSLTTLLMGIIIVFTVRGLLAWGVFGASFTTDAETVEVLRDAGAVPGAIWGIVGANGVLFSIGRYPIDLVWRVWASLGIVLGLAGLSTFAWNFGAPLKKYRQMIVYAWLFSLPLIYFLLSGIPGTEEGMLSEVRTSLWGGFLLTMVISVLGIVVSFPFGVLLALGRRSQGPGIPHLWAWGLALVALYWVFYFPTEVVVLNIPILFLDPPLIPITLTPMMYAGLQAIIVVGGLALIGHYLEGNLIKTFSITFIELIRGTPLIAFLFMASVMFQLFLPKELEFDALARVIIAVIMFSAAYLAENVRGGLQSIPKGQYEAAAALGLTTTQSTRLIILPQALRAVIPALVGQCIALFKDTSLVSIVGLFDLLKIAQTVVAQPDWLGLQRETFAFIALIYWVFAFSMSRASLRIEENLGVGKY